MFSPGEQFQDHAQDHRYRSLPEVVEAIDTFGMVSNEVNTSFPPDEQFLVAYSGPFWFPIRSFEVNLPDFP
jgi:hypothetical protein